MSYLTLKEVIRLFVESRGDDAKRGARDVLVALYAVLAQTGHEDLALQLTAIDLAKLQ